MRERVHGHIGIDLPVSGEQGPGRAVRPPRRRAPGPRPVRPYVPQAPVRRDGTPAARRAAEPGGAPDGGRAPALGAGAARGVRGGAPCRRRPRRHGCRAARGVTVRWMEVSWAALRCARLAQQVAGQVRRARSAARAGAAGRWRGGGRCGRRRGRGSWSRARAGPRRAAGIGLRRLLAGLALVLVAAAVVVGLGASRTSPPSPGPPRRPRSADGARSARSPWPGRVGEVTVTVTTAGTVWDVADRVAPGASGPQRAALVDRIVAANALTSMRVAPGQVLRVPV